VGAQTYLQMSEQAKDLDGLLLAGVARGDEDAFSQLYRRYLPLVLGWLVAETRDREASADLAAEVFAAALISAGRYRARKGAVPSWLIGIARNKLLESRRRQRVEDSARRRLGMEPVVLSDADLDRVDEIVGREPGLLGLLDRLPEDQRAALAGRVLEERTYPELAERLRCSEMVLRKRVSRALGSLRSQVQER
jgi:RNA polymerase sigma factor (sigma-70 family)